MSEITHIQSRWTYQTYQKRVKRAIQRVYLANEVSGPPVTERELILNQKRVNFPEKSEFLSKKMNISFQKNEHFHST